MYIMYMLCFCTLCSYATCEWPEFYVNKDMFCSKVNVILESKRSHDYMQSQGFFTMNMYFKILSVSCIPASKQSLSTICPPEKCHLNGVSLVGRWWPSCLNMLTGMFYDCFTVKMFVCQSSYRGQWLLKLRLPERPELRFVIDIYKHKITCEWQTVCL